jgi:Uma2 family endonuclease
MSTPALPKARMKVPEFLTWAEAQSRGRFELVEGEVVAMSPERLRHNLVKLEVALALREAIRAAKLPCIVFTDGATVVINDYTAREPDASVQCGIDIDLNSMILEAPLIVVEVVSPSSERDDTHTKLIEYFSVPSIRHYLIILPEKRVVVHHQRNDGGDIATRIVHDGEIALTPPGMTVPVVALLGPSSASGATTNSDQRG